MRENKSTPQHERIQQNSTKELHTEITSSLKPKFQKITLLTQIHSCTWPTVSRCQDSIKYNLETSDQEQNFSNVFLLWADLAKKKFHGLLLLRTGKKIKTKKTTLELMESILLLLMKCQ